MAHQKRLSTAMPAQHRQVFAFFEEGDAAINKFKLKLQESKN